LIQPSINSSSTITLLEIERNLIVTIHLAFVTIHSLQFSTTFLSEILLVIIEFVTLSLIPLFDQNRDDK